MQLKKLQLKFPRIRKSIIGAPFLILLFFLGFYITDQAFRVKRIEIISLSGKNTLQGSLNWNKKNLLFLSEKEIEENLEASNPEATQIVVKKIYPQTLQISVSYGEPVAYFRVDGGYYLVNNQGKIIAKSREKNKEMPVMQYFQKYRYTEKQVGEVLEYKDIQTALHFLQSTLDLGLVINTIDINGSNMIALLLNDRKILFTTEKDLQTQDYQLVTIIRQFKVEGKNFVVLDLRFDKPIIQFTQ